MITGEGARRRASGTGRRSFRPITRTAAGRSVHAVANGDAPEQPQNPPEEVALVNASIGGSLGAFEELYTRYFPKIRAFCYRKTGNPELAQDITQEAFTKAFEKINRFGGPKRFGSWVSTIAANLVTDHYRRKSTSDVPLDAAVDGDRLPAVDVDPLAGVEQDNVRSIVRPALDRLQPRQREALLLHEIEGMSCAAVAQRFGISEVAAESLVARGRRKLRREILAKVGPDELFGAGAVAPLAHRWHPVRRLREMFSRSTAWVHTTSGRALDAVGMGPLPAGQAARAFAVVIGTALAIDAAAALSPPKVPVGTPKPAAVAASAQKAEPMATAKPRIGQDVLHRLGSEGGVSYDDETGEADGSFEGEIKPPGEDPHSGLHYSFHAKAAADGSAEGQVFVNDDEGNTAADTGRQSVDW